MVVTKRVLVCTDFLFPAYFGGSARFASDLVHGLECNKVSVSIISRPAGGDYSGITDKTKHSQTLTYNPFRILLSNFSSFDLIVSHHPLFALIPAIFRRKKLVYFFHGPFADEYLSKAKSKRLGYWVRYLVERFVLSRAQSIIVLSSYMQKKLPYGVHYKTQIRGPIHKLKQLQNINVQSKPRSKLKILTVRRLTPRTGVEELCEMISKFQNVTLTVVGNGELLPQLKRKYGKFINFVGKVDEDSLQYIYEKHDVVVLPSIDLEGFGLVILEALSFGVPLLVTKTSGGAYDFLKSSGIRYFLDFSEKEELFLEKVSNIQKNYCESKVRDSLSLSFHDSYSEKYTSRFLNDYFSNAS